MFPKEGGRLQPHDAVVATKKHQTAYLCARPPNLLEQRRSKNCLEPHCRIIHPKGGRAAGAAKTTGKLGAGRAFGENKGGGGKNKIGLLCDSANQNCKKKLDLVARKYTVAHCAETIFPRPKNDPFPIPNVGGRLTINRKQGNACLGYVSSTRNRKKGRLGA